MPYKSLVLNPPVYNEGHTDKQSQFYKGFSTTDPEAKDVKLYDNELVKQDILNQFQVRKNERVMNPNFGTIIWDLLFEPFTESIKRQIASDVTRIVTSDPRANCTEVNVVEQEYGVLLEVTLVYNSNNLSETIKLGFDKSSGLSTL